MIKILREGNKEFYPATITDAIGHDQCKCSLTDLIDSYNVSTIWPSEEPYTLSSAIEILNENLLGEQKRPGVSVGFINSNGEHEEWEYYTTSYDFTDPLGWRLGESGKPLTLLLTVDKDLFKKGDIGTVTLGWQVLSGDEDVTTKSVKMLNGELIEYLDAVISLSNTATFKVSASYQGSTVEEEITVYFVDPSYYGVDGEELTEILLKSKEWTWENVNLTYQKTVYSYPVSYGKLTSIKDMNGLEYLKSYTLTEEDGYYTYILTNPVTIEETKQIFS